MPVYSLPLTDTAQRKVVRLMLTDTATITAPVLLIRAAKTRSQCRCAKPQLGYRAELMIDDIVADTSPQPLPTREDAERWAVTHTDRTHTATRVVPEPNLDYRSDCLTTILPGDRYIEDTHAERDGAHYCLRCGIARAASPTGADTRGAPAPVHSPDEIFMRCDCDPADPAYDAAHFAVDGVGFTCARGFLYAVCTHCCTGENRDHCEAAHHHGHGQPWCPASASESYGHGLHRV